MAIVRPFRGLRPQKELADKVAAPPYDVLSSEEAREIAKDNPYSFLHVNKPEIDLDPSIDLYDERVYQKGAENLKKLISDGILFQDEEPRYYIYKQVMGSHQQVGIVGCASVEEYEKDIIKKHELTRPDKEDDRVKHILYQNAQVGPVFLTYHASPAIDAIVEKIMEDEPEYDFRDELNVQHTLWVVRDVELIREIQNQFSSIPFLYVADGHHRSAAAMRVKQMKQKENPSHTGEEEYNFFLTVIFPHNQMQILDYNRVVKDLNGLSEEEFLNRLKEHFEVEPHQGQYKPTKAHNFGMYLNGRWYKLTARQEMIDESDPVKRLDVSILQENVLAPILGIADPRKDKRIDFVGGIRGLGELEKRVNSGNWAVAFALYPTSIEDLMAIADAGKIMPPKSTWFEPKLRTGLVVHLLD
ncbi:MAG: DUF1015 domain-containing protein [Calditrichaeota bacterium]|nr:MAG: DUF1015 domain-containing protein [Calditrichota bacterium]